MKKALLFLCAAALLCGCGQDRTEILKVYNWSDYIDESVIPEFEEWYEEQTGEPVRVIYQTFDVNETMLSKIEKGHEDFDVVCPSDYIIERMLANDMLLPMITMQATQQVVTTILHQGIEEITGHIVAFKSILHRVDDILLPETKHKLLGRLIIIVDKAVADIDGVHFQ